MTAHDALILCMWFTPVGRGCVRLPLLLPLLPPLPLPPLLPLSPPPLCARGPCWRSFSFSTQGRTLYA